MSAPSTMNCERANQLLTELVCGELDADEAASVRTHAETCARCGPELSRFARVLSVAQELPLEAPAPAVEQRIMLAAREALSRRAGGAVAMDSGTPSGGIKAWLERLGTWAMSPQVAMASVLLLVVGIGLYALPFGEDSAPAALQLAQEPEGAPAPSAAATTAPMEAAKDVQPLPGAAPDDDLKRAMEPAMEAPQGLKEERAEKPSLHARRALESKATSYGGGKKGDAFGELDGLGGLSAEGSGAATGGTGGRGNSLGPAPAPKPVSPAQDRAVDDLMDSNFAPAPPPVPAEQSAEAPRRAAEPSAPAPVAAESADYEEAPVASTRARDESAKQKAESPPEPSYATMLADGIAAAQAGNYARAVSLLDPVVASGPISMRSSARTWLARSLRGLGQCERALTYYAPLVDAPSPPIAILNEAADCYARVGRTAQAEELRMRAKGAGAKAAVPVKAAPVAPATKQ